MATYLELLDELQRRTGRQDMRGARDFDDCARTALRVALDRAAIRHPFSWWMTEAYFGPAEGTQSLSLPPDCVMVRYIHDPRGRRMQQRAYGRVMDYGPRGVPANSYTIKPNESGPVYAVGSCQWAKDGNVAVGTDTDWTSALENRVLAFRDDPEWAWIEEVLSPTQMRLSKPRRGETASGDHYSIDPSGHSVVWFLTPLRGDGDYRLTYSRRPRVPTSDGESPDLPEMYHYTYLLWFAYATVLEVVGGDGNIDRARAMAESCFQEMVTAGNHILGETPWRIIPKNS